MAVLQPSSVLARLQTAMAMWVRIITSKRSILHSLFTAKPAPCWPARLPTIHSLPRWSAHRAKTKTTATHFVLYDHVADRWVITDFAFASFPGTNFYECVAYLRARILLQAPGLSMPC